jgi:hypothetical protein
VAPLVQLLRTAAPPHRQKSPNPSQPQTPLSRNSNFTANMVALMPIWLPFRTNSVTFTNNRHHAPHITGHTPHATRHAPHLKHLTPNTTTPNHRTPQFAYYTPHATVVYPASHLIVLCPPRQGSRGFCNLAFTNLFNSNTAFNSCQSAQRDATSHDGYLAELPRNCSWLPANFETSQLSSKHAAHTPSPHRSSPIGVLFLSLPPRVHVILPFLKRHHFGHQCAPIAPQ